MQSPFHSWVDMYADIHTPRDTPGKLNRFSAAVIAMFHSVPSEFVERGVMIQVDSQIPKHNAGSSRVGSNLEQPGKAAYMLHISSQMRA